MGKPWNGDYGFSSGDLVRDLTHNFFLETGVRNGKLKVYEMVDHPAARALTGYLLVRGGVHQVAYARAVERLTGADLTKMSVLRFRPPSMVGDQPQSVLGAGAAVEVPELGARALAPVAVRAPDRRRSRGDADFLD